MTTPVVQTHDLSMRFDGVVALNKVSIALQERELRCLIGPNGAGKSTLFKCLTGQHRIKRADGRISIRGRDVTGWRPSEIVRLGVGIKTQVPSVMNGLTVAENLWLAANRIYPKSVTASEVGRVVDELRLGSVLPRRVSELSHGQRQIVEIGLVLVQRSWLVLLDEPAAGITAPEAERLIELIQHVNQSAAVMVVDHDMHFVRGLGGAVTVLHQGSILMEGSAGQVLSDDRVREVYIGNRVRSRC